MNFIVSGMTYLRYFLPIAIEGKKRGIESRFFICRSNKPNCPFLWREVLTNLSNKYGFSVHEVQDIKNFKGVTFVIENDGLQHLDSNHYKVSLTYLLDFYALYDSYKDRVDKVVFLSEFLADYYGKTSNKNLYLGSPKYDISFDKKEILRNFNIDESKRNILIIGPPTRNTTNRFVVDHNQVSEFYNSLRGCLPDYNFIFKTRSKDPISTNNFCNNLTYKFEDSFWFPHDTMQLMHISDFIISFDSTGVKEMVMMEKPFLNFNISIPPYYHGLKERTFDFLFKFDFCIDTKIIPKQDEIKEYVQHLLQNNFSFKNCKSKYLCNHKNVSNLILNEVL